MNYSKIIYYDTANARGLSTVLFVSGCNHFCPKCFNKETWAFDAGKLFTEKEEEQIIDSLKKPFTDNLVISGGDPFMPLNIKTVLNFVSHVKDSVDTNIIVYTGFTMEEIKQFDDFSEINNGKINYIIDGEFKEDLVSPILDFRGSLNQKAWKFNGKEFENVSTNYFKYKNS